MEACFAETRSLFMKMKINIRKLTIVAGVKEGKFDSEKVMECF